MWNGCTSGGSTQYWIYASYLVEDIGDAQMSFVVHSMTPVNAGETAE